MAHSGTFPVAEALGVAGTSPWSGRQRHGHARALALVLAGVFVAGSGVAAAGISYEAEGYGVLSIVAGGIIGVASAVPLWLLLRSPRRPART